MQTLSSEQMQDYAEEFLSTLTPRSRAIVVALSGELGAGKTTFTQGIARALGIEETVASPTFVIEKIYQLKGQRFERLIHIDAYRLKSAHELEVLGWEEIAGDPGNLIVIEWPERVPELIPVNAIRISFEIDGDERIITVNDGEKNLQSSN